MLDARDGQRYKTVVIANKTWMAENLNYSGDDGQGHRAYNKGWCYVSHDPDTTQHQDNSNCDNGYGRLYNWTDAMDISRDYLQQDIDDSIQYSHQGICPAGWRVPTNAEVDTLFRSQPNVMPGIMLKENGAWGSSQVTNSTGFSALPAGHRNELGYCESRGGVAEFWTSTPDLPYWAFQYRLEYDVDYINVHTYEKMFGKSLRCMKD